MMGSAGGLLALDHAVREPVHTVLSGPAGGVRGAAVAGRRAGRDRLLTLDMGGTSTDVSVLLGEVVPDDASQIDTHPLRVPILPIETVGAGGGSIAVVDEGGALTVGPRSAGAIPGPACYGRGGTEATVTDAHVVLGRIDALLGGSMPLDREESRRVVAQLAAEIGTTLEETASAIIAIAEANMARACKRVTMERGVDPRTLTLVAFGGAGGLHACALADALGCRDVLFPRSPGVLSAEGIGHAPREASASHSALTPLDAFERAPVDTTIREARALLGTGEAKIRVFVDTRFQGQTFTLPVEIGEDDLDPELRTTLRDRFLALHEDRYGYVLDATPIEVVALRTFAQRSDVSTEHSAADTDELQPGPRAVSTYGATLWVPEGWVATRLASGDWRVERKGAANSAQVSSHEPLALEIHRQRLAAIAEEMGSALMRAALSANIKERRDFSCAVFDGHGEMIAQAAHIPVHLGSQPLSVRAAIEQVEMKPGQSVVLNAPYSGGTHLPDVTLVTPVFLDGDASPSFFVANRAHHADVGGLSPGSMPAPRRPDGTTRALSIEDEGFVLEPQPLTDHVRQEFANASRTPLERFGDLRAQEAANHVGTRRILELAESVAEVHALNRAVLDYGERRMRAVLAALPDGEYRFEDTLENDGFDTKPIAIRLTLTTRGDDAVFDFSESDNQTPGALNAVRAITESAVFYAMRCLGGDGLPSNAGLMRPATVKTRPGSIVDAQAPAAVSAGNVETSQ
ncbi:MAG: hydantoinase B/oxoprolinase family protein, partial [Myxococcota bacterium]